MVLCLFILFAIRDKTIDAENEEGMAEKAEWRRRVGAEADAILGGPVPGDRRRSDPATGAIIPPYSHIVAPQAHNSPPMKTHLEQNGAGKLV